MRLEIRSCSWPESAARREEASLDIRIELMPCFLASFTATKSAIPFLVGYTWDHFWAQADRIIFGDDVWRIAHQWLGNGATRPLEWFYIVVWGIALIFVSALVPLNASARFTAKFYTAMMATWIVCGFVLAGEGKIHGQQAAPQPPTPEGYVPRGTRPGKGLAPGMKVTDLGKGARTYRVNFAKGDEIMSGLTEFAEKLTFQPAQVRSVFSG